MIDLVLESALPPLKMHRQMADMMKAMGASAGKRGLMGQLGQMMGFGGGMAMPTPEQIAEMQKSAGAAPPTGGIPSAPPPGAFNLPPQFPGLPGLGAPRPPGLGGGLPFGGKKK